MQKAKDMVAAAKEKIGNAGAAMEEGKEQTKFAAEEKVDKMKAHGDEGAKQEATAKRNEREAGAGQHREAEERSNYEDKERAVNPNSGNPIGDKPTPADLDRVMGADNPTNPENPEVVSNPAGDYGRSNYGPICTNVVPGQVPTPLGPSSAGQVA